MVKKSHFYFMLSVVFLKKRKRKLLIMADPTRGGDLGNYWHYMLGYFLPLVIWLTNNKKRYQGNILVIDSCNPLMDAHITDFLNFCEISFEFKNLTPKTLEYKIQYGKSKLRLISNLLQVLERKLLGKNAFIFIYHNFRRRNGAVKMPRWDEYLQQYEELPPTFKKNFRRMKKQLFDFAGVNSTIQKKSILVIQRSSPNHVSSIKEGNKARWFEGYGTQRRRLLGVESAVCEMKKSGLPPKIFEPGIHSLREQILTFSTCSIMIGIRGAEFINMLWAPQNSSIIMYESIGFKTKAIQPILAKALNLKIIIEDHQGVDSPVISYQKISTHISPIFHEIENS